MGTRCYGMIAGHSCVNMYAMLPWIGTGWDAVYSEHPFPQLIALGSSLHVNMYAHATMRW